MDQLRLRSWIWSPGKPVDIAQNYKDDSNPTATRTVLPNDPICADNDPFLDALSGCCQVGGASGSEIWIGATSWYSPTGATAVQLVSPLSDSSLISLSGWRGSMALRIGLKLQTYSINARAGTSFWLIMREWSGYQLAFEFFPQYICCSIYCTQMLGTISISSQSAGISMPFWSPA
jgi:hypothetical protein